MTKGKNIIVVAAYGDIASRMLPVFYAQGATLTLAGRDPDKLKMVASQFDPKRVKIVVADATKPAQMKKVLKVSAAFGLIDAVVVAAGSHAVVSLDTPTQEAMKILKKHVQEFIVIPFVVVTATMRVFRAQDHGLFVNISSHITARKDLKGNLTYRMTKKASDELLDDVRNEIKGSKVRLTTIAPSTVNVPNNAKYLPTAEAKAKAVQPEAIAKLILKNIDDHRVPSWQLLAGGSDF